MDNRKTGQTTLRVSNQCSLEHTSQELANRLKKHLTIANPKYTAAKRYGRWIGKKMAPELYFFREEKDVFHFPRGFANQAVMLHRELHGEDPMIIDERLLLPKIELIFKGELRSYQQEAIGAITARSFGVLEAGTGSGKTVMALGVIAERKQPTLIVVHSKELLYQWVARIEEFLGEEAGIIGDGKFCPQPLSVAIVNTARKLLAELTWRFGQIIVDECHRVPASLFTDVVSGFNSHYMLGLSATAFCREDGMTKLIYYYMGDRVHGVDMERLARSGAVIRPSYEARETSFSYGFTGEYSAMIKALAGDANRNELISRDILGAVADGHEGTVLVVSDRVAHCELLADKLNRSGVRAVVLTGKTNPARRVEIVGEVRDGKVPVLLSTLQLIGEGFDCPGLTTLVLVTPIKFQGRLLQVVGRIMRPAVGKSARVIDYHDVHVPLLRKSSLERMHILQSL